MNVDFTKAIFIWSLLAAMLLGWSCASDQAGVNSEEGQENERSINEYANGFEVQYFQGYKKISVNNPWKDAEVSFTYVLTEPGVTYQAEDEYTTVINQPVTSIVCFSTTHISTFEALGSTSLISGLANTALVYSPAVRKLIAQDSIVDVGHDYELDYEKLVALQPELIFMYAMGSGFLEKLAKLESLGLNVVVNGEYMEGSPLGQAEWMKFIAAFIDKEEEATQIFNQVSDSYEVLKLLANRESKPTVFCNLPWKGTWYIPGGRSFTSQLIADAGGDYLWKSNNVRGSLNMDFEVVFEKAFDADIWINPGSEVDLVGIAGSDPKHRQFKAFQNANVFNHYRRINESGGNDYFESGTIRPDLVLKDLIQFFHPHLLPEDSLTYYIKLS